LSPAPCSAPETLASGYFLFRRWTRVRFNSFRCFFLRMRFRRFLISDPMRDWRLAAWYRIATTIWIPVAIEIEPGEATKPLTLPATRKGCR
jgi:hypothetical protein